MFGLLCLNTSCLSSSDRNVAKNHICGLCNYLSSRYNLEDVININGSVFYAKMGTSFNTRIILINGRRSKPQEIWFPIEDKTLLPEESFAPHQVVDFNVLFTRVDELIKN